MLSLRMLKKHKRSTVAVMIAETFCIMCLVVIYTLSGSYLDTLTEFRKNIYGEWKAVMMTHDAEKEAAVKASGVISEQGVYRFGGRIVNSAFCADDITGAEIQYPAVGYMDEEAVHMLAIKLTEGTLPASRNEAVIEKDFAAAMGYADIALGDTVQFDITVTAQNGSGHTVPKEYTVCGIAEPYFINFGIIMMVSDPFSAVCEAERGINFGIFSMPCVLVTADEASSLDSIYPDAYFFTSDASDRRVSDVMRTVRGTVNSRVYAGLTHNLAQSAAGVSSEIEDVKMVKDIFIVLFSGMLVMVLLLVTRVGISGRIRSLRLLRAIGQTRRQAVRMLITEAIITSTVSSAVGIPCGIALSWLGRGIMARVMESPVVFSPRLTSIIGIVLFASVLIIISTVLPALPVLTRDPVTGHHRYHRRVGPQRSSFAVSLPAFALRRTIAQSASVLLISAAMTISLFVAFAFISAGQTVKAISGSDLTTGQVYEIKTMYALMLVMTVLFFASCLTATYLVFKNSMIQRHGTIVRLHTIGMSARQLLATAALEGFFCIIPTVFAMCIMSVFLKKSDIFVAYNDRNTLICICAAVLAEFLCIIAVGKTEIGKAVKEKEVA